MVDRVRVYRMDAPKSPSSRMATSEQVRELEAFLQWQDASAAREDSARKLLEMHPIELVGLAIREKYGILPGGWREFVPAKRVSLPRPVAEVEPSLADSKINEILDSEIRFLHTMDALQRKFIEPVLAVFHSQRDRDVEALGITHADTNRLFAQLPPLITFSLTLLNKLMGIDLVRAQPVTGEGRAIHVARAFLEMAPTLHVYAPAILCYETSLQILHSVSANAQAKAKAKRRSFSNKVEIKPSFFTMWEESSLRSPELRGQQLMAVLLTPMQRILRYRMLLETLLRECEPGTEAHRAMDQALGLVSTAAKEINSGLAKHQKLVDILGQDFCTLTAPNNNNVKI